MAVPAYGPPLSHRAPPEAGRYLRSAAATSNGPRSWRETRQPRVVRALGGRDGPVQPGPLVLGQQRHRDLEVSLVLRPQEPRLEVQRDLRAHVPDPVVRDPGDVVERRHVRAPALVGPEAV